MTAWRSRLIGRFDAAVRWRADEQATAALQPVQRDVAWALNELQRLGSQLAALEVRLEDQRSGERPDGTAVEVSARPAEENLGELRAEHRRIRARMGLVTNYVQRLERLERRVFDEVANGQHDPVDLGLEQRQPG